MSDRPTLGSIKQNTAILICGHCFNKERELRMVSFDYDGPQAVCDLDHETEDAEQGARVMAVEHIFTWEPGLEFLKTLEVGQMAWKPGPDTWTVEEI